MKGKWAIPVIASILILFSTLSLAIGHASATTEITFGFDDAFPLTPPLNSYSEDGFDLTSTDIVGANLSFGDPPPSMIPSTPFSVQTLTKEDDGSFDLISIDLREITINTDSGAFFTAEKEAGGVVTQGFTTFDNIPGFETFVFNGFTDITSVSWSGRDDAGIAHNSLIVDNIVLRVSTPPTITCPADVTLESPADTSPANTGFATATDNVDPNPAITFTDIVSGSNPTIITRTWTATDASGNSSECVQIITVTTPEIEIGGTLIPIDTTTLLLASVQSISMWLIPVVAAGIGIGVFVIKRRK